MSEAAPPAGAAAEPSAPPADAAAAAGPATATGGVDAAPASQEPTSIAAAADATTTSKGATNKTKEDFELGTAAGMTDDALEAKMRQAQERLEGLDKHVADLKRRSEEQDAISKVRERDDESVGVGARERSGAEGGGGGGGVYPLPNASLLPKKTKLQPTIPSPLPSNPHTLSRAHTKQQGKLPPDQTMAYTARVKELEQKRRELLQRQLGVGEELQRVASTNGGGWWLVCKKKNRE